MCVLCCVCALYVVSDAHRRAMLMRAELHLEPAALHNVEWHALETHTSTNGRSMELVCCRQRPVLLV